MAPKQDIVVTGVGVVSPIGIGKNPFWTALCEGRSGIRRLELFDDPTLFPLIGGLVADFDPKQYVRPRKSLKVMSRDIQLGFAAADMACVDAGLRETPPDPERLVILQYTSGSTSEPKGVMIPDRVLGANIDASVGVLMT